MTIRTRTSESANGRLTMWIWIIQSSPLEKFSSNVSYERRFGTIVCCWIVAHNDGAWQSIVNILTRSFQRIVIW